MEEEVEPSDEQINIKIDYEHEPDVLDEKVNIEVEDEHEPKKIDYEHEPVVLDEEVNIEIEDEHESKKIDYEHEPDVLDEEVNIEIEDEHEPNVLDEEINIKIEDEYEPELSEVTEETEPNWENNEQTQNSCTDPNRISILLTDFPEPETVIKEKGFSVEATTIDEPIEFAGTGASECDQYLSIIETAELLVDSIISEASEIYQVLSQTESHSTHSSGSNEDYDTIKDESSLQKEDKEKSEISYVRKKSLIEKTEKLVWPTIAQFTAEVGENRIIQYIKQWKMEEDWMHFVKYVGEYSDECTDYYRYEVKWSIPCKQYPVAQATASVFFTIEVSRVKPRKCPVNVVYQFEGNRLIHNANRYQFDEAWLFYIIDSKLNLFKQLTF